MACPYPKGSKDSIVWHEGYNEGYVDGEMKILSEFEEGLSTSDDPVDSLSSVISEVESVTRRLKGLAKRT